jgi:hypothetical protein
MADEPTRAAADDVVTGVGVIGAVGGVALADWPIEAQCDISGP